MTKPTDDERNPLDIAIELAVDAHRHALEESVFKPVEPTVERTPVEEAWRRGRSPVPGLDGFILWYGPDQTVIPIPLAVEESIRTEAIRPYVEAIQGIFSHMADGTYSYDEVERRLRALVDSIPEQGETQ